MSTVNDIRLLMAREQTALRIAFKRFLASARSPSILTRLAQALRNKDTASVFDSIEEHLQKEFLAELPKSFVRVANAEVLRARPVFRAARLRRGRQVGKSVSEMFKAWEESKHPRDDYGRFAPIGGGSSRGARWWHGTSSNLLDSIRKSGLVPGARSAIGISISGYNASVFIVRDFDMAESYAMRTRMLETFRTIRTRGLKVEKVILRIRLSKEQKNNLVVDEADAGDRELLNQTIQTPTQYRLVGTIPPHQIDVYENGKWRQLAKNISKADATEIFYVVIPIDPAPISKAGEDLWGSIDFSFDPTDEDAARLMEKLKLDFLDDFSAKQKKAIQRVLAQSLRDGDSYADAARSIRDVIGLTDTQAQAVNNYRALLKGGNAEALQRQLRDRRFDNTVTNAISRGDILSDDQIDRMVDRYTERMLAFRADTIAATESHRVLSLARYEAWGQMTDELGLEDGEFTRTWNSTEDDRVRDTHEAMDGQTVQGFEPFESPSGAKLDYPGDPKAPAAEVIACRCVETYDLG